MIITEKNERKKKKQTNNKKNLSTDIQNYSQWLRVGGRLGGGFEQGLKSFWIYCHIMQSVIKHLFAW